MKKIKDKLDKENKTMGIKEKILMTITIILLVIMIGMACYSVYNGKKEEEKDANIINEIDLNQTTATNTVEENEPTEEETENIVNEIVTPTIQPNVTEEEINSDYIGTEEQQTVNTEQTEEEKVIELVKNEYGTDQGVTFNIANKEGTIYHVSVNDVETTAVIAWYTVDISTNTVTRS